MRFGSELRQRQVALSMMTALIITGVVVTGIGVVAGDASLLSFAASITLAFAALLAAYARGWEPARHLLVIVLAVGVPLGLPEPLFPLVSPAVLLPTAVAMVLAGPDWMVASFVVTLAGFVWHSGSQPPYNHWSFYAVVATLLTAMVLSRLLSDNARRAAETSARLADERARDAEGARRLAEQQAVELQQRNADQERLIDLVQALEIPTIAVAEGVLLAPIVGSLDSRRAADFTARLLQDASARRVRRVILDITGVTAVDTQVMQALLRSVHALRLLGCEVTLTGVSAAVATTITHLGVGVGDLTVARTPQEALELRS